MGVTMTEGDEAGHDEQVGRIHATLNRACWWRPWHVVTVCASWRGHTFTARERVLTGNASATVARLVDAARVWAGGPA